MSNSVPVRTELKHLTTNSVITLYHGTTHDFTEINVSRGKPFKDFGVRFVVLNRTNETPQHDYDVVIGATANDVTSRTAQLYMAGEYGDVDSDEAVEFFLRRIQPERLPVQFLFGTQRAANLLVLKGKQALQ
jgi:hypothetical protein